MNPLAPIISGIAFCLGAPSFASESCEVNSGPATAALIELYTSEGCSSCPPADRELGKLQRSFAADPLVIPIALHVSYWDYIGWKDRFAQTIFDERQRQLAAFEHNRLVYTPEFFVNGKELRHWGRELSDAIRRINAKPAQASIRLKWAEASGNAVRLDAIANARNPGADQSLFLAVSESKLVSNVLRGENSNTTLMHDATVRMWLGPVKLAGGNARMHQDLRLPADWNRANLRAVAFVQNNVDGTIDQAVSIGPCDPGKS
ncbi:DUF1223 domain-containing protein [Noviherbaspirillum galbum]|uniref:DUF1223 domain-containing protein n=1 Tax=Noviherbaspirillum galbum TaxID=2709383 RepID=A0A6B3SRE2_9BURK|nr:DUF1223 domain-containing protein [Noviherbaspirillum galbum]NEX60992.1 DUF1223 domain-containing protein [Noviherbaspirillum galbum]